MKKKKVCFFANSMFKIGGEQRMTTLIANKLVDKNIDVTIIIKNKEKVDYRLYNLSKKVKLINLDYTYDFRLNNSKFFNLLRSINRKIGIFKNNKKLIRHFFCSNKIINDLKIIFYENKYDVVVGVAGDRSYILSYLKEFISGKLIYWNHMNFDNHYINKNSRYYNEESFIKPLLKNFDEIVNLNIDDVIKFKKYYDVKSIVINNCKSFESKEKSKLTNHKFMTCGRLVKQKGYDKLIEIFKIFHEENKKYKLDIYGEGPLKKKIENKIKQYGLEKNIRLHGEEREVKSLYLRHDIYLNTSIHEGFGLTTLEALECGLPIICFDIPANTNLVKDDVNGRVIKSFDINEYAKVLLELSNDKKKLNMYQKNIPKLIKEFEINKVINKWLDIINK